VAQRLRAGSFQLLPSSCRGDFLRGCYHIVSVQCKLVVSMDAISEEYWILCDTHYKWLVNMGSTPKVIEVVMAYEKLLTKKKVCHDRSV
jgi:hypothetical protein